MGNLIVQINKFNDVIDCARIVFNLNCLECCW